MNKVGTIIGIIIIIGIIGLVLVNNSKKTKDASTVEQIRMGQGSVPNLSFSDYNGTTIAFADFKGTPLVINSWAAWCPFCLKELPDFAAVQKEFGDQVVIIAIDRAESLKTSKRYTDDLGITDDLIFLLDPKDSFYRAIVGFSMPETIFVDSEGIIREHKRGVMNLEEIRERINRLLTIEKQ